MTDTAWPGVGRSARRTYTQDGYGNVKNALSDGMPSPDTDSVGTRAFAAIANEIGAKMQRHTRPEPRGGDHASAGGVGRSRFKEDAMTPMAGLR